MKPVAARYSPTARRLFDRYLPFLFRRTVQRILVRGPLDRVDADLPVLLVANHTSWWDGFILWELQRRLRPNGRVRSLMLESGMREHALFRWLGGIPMRPGDPVSIRQAFRAAREERERFGRQLAIVYLPQGKIWPATRRPLGFQRGVELLARELDPITVVPIGIHAELLTSPKPSLFVAIGEPRPSATIDACLLEDDVETLLDGIQHDLASHGEALPDRWCAAPGAFPLY
jgi:1-acyl-sn-glycerol-3-phosphate acyltransferase